MSLCAEYPRKTGKVGICKKVHRRSCHSQITIPDAVRVYGPFEFTLCISVAPGRRGCRPQHLPEFRGKVAGSRTLAAAGGSFCRALSWAAAREGCTPVPFVPGGQAVGIPSVTSLGPSYSCYHQVALWNRDQVLRLGVRSSREGCQL